MTFHLPDAFDGNEIVPGPRITYELKLAPGEQMNGDDDNGNGLIDEGQLIRYDPEEPEGNPICHGIDLAASRFELNGTAVDVTLAVSGFLPHDKSPHTTVRSLKICPRN